MKSKNNWIFNAKRIASPYYKKYLQMQIWVRAEALAFHTILAIIPILGFAFWLLNRFGVTGEWLEVIKIYVLNHLSVVSNANLDQAIDSVLSSLRHQSVGFFGTFFLIYSSWKLITKFGAAQDKILNVKLAEETPINLGFVVLTLRRAFLMLSMPLVLGMSIFAATWIRDESWIRVLFHFENVGPFFALPLAWSVGIIAFSVLYYFVPRKRVRWWSAFKAAAIVVPGLEVTRFLLGIFNQYAVTTHKVYGIFAVVPFTFLWIQVAWVIILAGGLFLKVRRKRA